MKYGISSLSFSGPLENKIEAAAAVGFDGIEIFAEDLIYAEGKPVDIGRLARDAGIRILSLQSLRDFEARPDGNRDWTLQRAERFLDLAAEIGAPLLVVCANAREDTVADPARAAADLAALADMAAARGLKIGFEALSNSRVTTNYVDAWSIVKQADHPNLDLIIGAVHTFATGTGLGAIDHIDPAKIALVHLGDASRRQIVGGVLGRHLRVFPGQGDLPVGELYGRLRGIGYDGPLSLEVFDGQVRALPAERIAKDGIRSFRLLEEAADATAPPNEVVDDIGFVEIACGGDESAELKRTLADLGFARTHAHRSMNVSLYRQGDIDLVINEDSESQAHSFYLMHGLSVFALAFRVRDLAEMTARVERNHGGVIERHGGRVTGHDILAIRGVGGSFVYLLDGSPDAPNYYAGEFDPVVEDTAPVGKGLRAYDHFSQAVPPQEALSSLLFYRALFGFEVDSQMDLFDPHGTVRSRTIRNGNDRVRFSLNASISPTSSTQRLISNVAGAGFQHFAFRCDDILAYAKSVPAEMMLQIPDNYYDDLRLRFDIDDVTLQGLRKHNILYDRDAGGAYFQLYTQATNGLSFEIIQRDGYRGFGARNATVRMAAQARDFEREQNLILQLDHGRW